MTPLKALLPLLCVLASACISLPGIEDPPSEEPSPDAGVQDDGGVIPDGGGVTPDGGGITDGGLDQIPPAIIRTSPLNGATSVPIDSAVEIDFSEEMLPSTLRLTSEPPVSFSLASWASGPRRAVFTASAPLDQDKQYTVSVEGKDVAGNSLAGAPSFTFTTAGPPDTARPTLVEVSPSPYASGVPRDTTIKLTFSEPMNKASVERAFSIRSPTGITIGSITWNAPGTEVVFTPGTAFPYNAEVTWEFLGEATDLAGNAFFGSPVFFSVIRLSTLRVDPTQSNSILASTQPVPETTSWPLGDDEANKPYHGFVSFSLEQLSSLNIFRINSAILTWHYLDPGGVPFDSLGRFMVDPVNYGLSTDGIFTTPSIGTPLFLRYQDIEVQGGYASIPVTPMVTDAWTNRSSRFGSAQFRLKFEYLTDNDSAPDGLQINLSFLYLSITCEHP